ncbi:DUF7638 domain-containing protein [Tenacibaculum sp. M341]|uniref:DUF7638 domain-containing protein n=1 Tax=Tenacibaculum sp. M341 TaxID=2530339 RepID=UPI001046441E|nr:hypothetical protein [Tenacibaculum sp. M341]TCI92171.1 hypothetical protein EYW44_08290 [Tenacibaculum sp. M341]
MSFLTKIYRDKNGIKIHGIKLPVIINDHGYYLTELIVYKDGLIDCWGLKSLEQIKAEVNSGKLLQSAPDNVSIECDLGTIKCGKFAAEKTNEGFIKEIEDTINTLNNRDTRITICQNAYKNYLINPSKENLNDLNEKYDDLPSHEKVLFEYTEEKDPLCKFIDEKETYTVDRRKQLLKFYFKFDL